MSESSDVGSKISTDALTSAKSERRMLTVTKMYHRSGVLDREESDDEPLEVEVPAADVPLASVGFGVRMTVNMGNYETVQVGVNAQLPCYVEEMDDALTTAKNFVDVRLNKEVKALRDYRKERDAS